MSSVPRPTRWLSRRGYYGFREIVFLTVRRQQCDDNNRRDADARPHYELREPADPLPPGA